MKIIISTIKKWNIVNAKEFVKKFASKHTIKIIDSKEKFNRFSFDRFKPDYIFFPHWSYIIPDEILQNFNCVVFHMTDLPYGRGGSPLQNLIVRGKETTKISAIKVVKELDAGPIYFKENLKLNGTAQEIYERASKIIFNKMLPRFLTKEIIPKPQTGKVVAFKRRTKGQSEITNCKSINDVYDYIRMLDAETYPNAFIVKDKIKYHFFNPYIKNKELFATVRITEDSNE